MPGPASSHPNGSPASFKSWPAPGGTPSRRFRCNLFLLEQKHSAVGCSCTSRHRGESMGAGHVSYNIHLGSLDLGPSSGRITVKQLAATFILPLTLENVRGITESFPTAFWKQDWKNEQSPWCRQPTNNRELVKDTVLSCSAGASRVVFPTSFTFFLTLHPSFPLWVI